MSKVKIRPWNSAEHLQSEEDIVAYLEACLEEGGDDAAFIVHALGVIARAQGMAALARKTGLTRKGCTKPYRIVEIRAGVRDGKALRHGGCGGRFSLCDGVGLGGGEVLQVMRKLGLCD